MATKIEDFSKQEMILIHAALVAAIKSAQRMINKYPVGSGMYEAARSDVSVIEALRSKVQNRSLEV